MKNTLKTLLILSSCLRLVLFTTTTLAGDEGEIRYNKFFGPVTQKLEKILTEDKMTCCEAIENYENASDNFSGCDVAPPLVCPSTAILFMAYVDVSHTCKFTPSSDGYDVERVLCELEDLEDNVDFDSGISDKKLSEYQYVITDSRKPNPFAKTNTAYLNKDNGEHNKSFGPVTQRIEKKITSDYADVPSSSYPDIESTLDSRKKNKNPLIKINDAKLERDYTDEECCEALEDYNDLVASCSRSQKGIARINLCEIIINRQTVLDRAEDDVKKKCDASPEALNHHHWIEHFCEDKKG